MRYQEQEIVLHTQARYGRRLPLDFCGDVCRQLAPMMLGSVRMAIEGTSSHVGAPPLWLRQASDVRLVGISEKGEGDTTLHLEAPPLGEAAEELYKQQTLWETKPAPQDTAVNVLARVMRDVRTVVSHGEIWAMAERNQWGGKKRQALSEMINDLVTLDVNDRSIIEAYVEVDKKNHSHPKGARVLSDNDKWIAATARAAAAVLLTTDQDFIHLNPDICTVHYVDSGSRLPVSDAGTQQELE